MIDFRYHLVSIIAVFLALAIGIFVGSTALKGESLAILRGQANQVTAENRGLIQHNRTLSNQVTFDQNFARAAAGRLLTGELTGRSVVLVTAPGADAPTVSAVTAAIRQAGGTVTGQVGLTTLFFDTSAATESLLSSLATQYQPQSGAGASAGSQFSGQQAAAAVLAGALVTKSDPLSSATAAPGQAAVSAFGQRDFLQLTGTSARQLQPAELAVVVPPATPPSGNDASPGNQILIAVAQALQAAGHGVVLASSLAGSGPGSAVDALSSGAISAALTTVDNADTTSGQISVVWALTQLLAGHKAMAYGVGPGAVPSPASIPATVSPSPSASASGGAGHRKGTP